MRWVQWFGDGKFSEVRLLPSPKHPPLHVSAPFLRLAVGCGCAPAASQASPPSVQHSQALQVLMALASVTNDWPL